MDKNVVYSFIGGLYIGRYTGWISNFVITGIAVYFYSPEVFTQSYMESLKDTGIKMIQSFSK